MDYETATDFDINKAVAEGLGHKLKQDDFYLDIFKERYPNRVWSVRPGHDHPQHNDYCNNPGDMHPITLEHKIGRHWVSFTLWQARGDNQGKPGDYKVFEAVDKNPLRAEAIVYLKMEDAKNG